MTPNGLRKWLIRKEARSLLDDIIARHGRCCYWCGRFLCLKSDFLPEEIIRKTPAYIYLNTPKGEVRDFLLTIDHVKPIREGGGNDLTNLVPACFPCNQERDHSSELMFVGTSLCIQCGSSCTPGYRYCTVCLGQYMNEAQAVVKGRKKAPGTGNVTEHKRRR